MEVTALKESSEDVQHFADRIFTKRGARYRRVAMFPTSATTTRRPKAQLTIVTAWSVQGPSRQFGRWPTTSGLPLIVLHNSAGSIAGLL
jgi:hypothetical protein